MDTESRTLALLERALDQTAVIVAAIRPDQAALPTPCAGWDVRALVEHLVGQDLRNYVISARGESADWEVPPDELGDDWSGAFQDGARRLLATWRAADLDQPVEALGARPPLRFQADAQITEFAAHNWDLVKSTGQHIELDPMLAEHALDWSRPILKPEYRGEAFGAEVPVPADAPPYDRLAGWLGRDPGWRPS